MSVCVCGVHRRVAIDVSGRISRHASQTTGDAAAKCTAKLRHRGARDESRAGQQNRDQRMASFESHIVLRSFDALPRKNGYACADAHTLPTRHDNAAGRDSVQPVEKEGRRFPSSSPGHARGVRQRRRTARLACEP